MAMAAPPETTSPQEGGVGGNNGGVEVCPFQESPAEFSSAVRAISELTAGEPDPNFPDAQVERLASSVTFDREWRDLCGEPKRVSFTFGAGSISSGDEITLPQFSSASVPQPQVTHSEDGKANIANSSDFILFAGGNVWSLDWCPRFCDEPCSPVNCEYLAVAAHPPSCAYHDIGKPLIGRGSIQVWCLIAPFEEAHPHQSLIACSKSNRRGRPRKIPDVNSSIESSSVPAKPIGRPRKIKLTTADDHTEQSLKRPRGRPRKHPLSVAKVLDSTKISGSRDSSFIDPLVISRRIPGDLALSCAIAAVKPAESPPENGRGRPRKIMKCLPGMDLKEDMSSAIVCMEPKKKRGRPRKYPPPSSSKHVSGTHTDFGRETVCVAVSAVCNSGYTGYTESNSNLSVVTVDAALPVLSPGITVCDKRSRGRRGRGQPNKEIISGTESSKAVTTINDLDNHLALAKNDGEIIASDLTSVGSLRCHRGKCNVDLSAALSDPASPAHGLWKETYKESSCAQHRKKTVSTECSSSTTFEGEQNNQSTPKPSDNVASVEKCKKELHVYTRRRVLGLTKKFASDETCSLALSSDVQKMEKSSTSIMPNNHLSFVEKPKLLGSSVSEDMASGACLVGCKSAVVNCEIMGMNDSETVNQIVPLPFENSPQVIDELEDTEVAPFQGSSNNGNTSTCVENLNFSAIKGIHLPRVVLCLVHDGEVAWDIKWKPPTPNQSEQKSCLGFLAALLGNGSLEVWEVPSPSMIQKIYSSSLMEGTDPRFLKLRPVFRCANVKCGNRQSIPLVVDWSPSPHDMILAGCHDGTVALWKFSTDLSSQDSKPFVCVTAEYVPIRALSWAPYESEGITHIFVTAGEDGLKFWDLRDPYRPLWELTTAPKAIVSLHWLKDTRGIVISLEDGTLKFLSLPRIANYVPVTGTPFAGTKTQGVHTYQLSEYLIWNVHVSEITGYAAYCGADGTAVRFQLTSRFFENQPGRNRVPYFLCGSLAEEGTVIKIGGTLQYSPLPNVPLVAKKVPEAQGIRKEKLQTTSDSEDVDPEPREGQLDGPGEGEESNASVLTDPLMQENGDTVREYPKDFEVFPPRSVALHRLRWNMNKGSEKWLCYGGAAGIIRCQRI